MRNSTAINVVKMAVKAMRIRNWWGLEGDRARRGTMILALPKLVLM
ncbi:MAG: hypothetical protein OXH65_01585 [Paracoccaceae bacterium]|nr:hypothetical protein [Paracoccaceae bacterium]MDE2673782.1 hypothetical protein [Paracoccaceae bacterium]